MREWWQRQARRSSVAETLRAAEGVLPLDPSAFLVATRRAPRSAARQGAAARPARRRLFRIR